MQNTCDRKPASRKRADAPPSDPGPLTATVQHRPPQAHQPISQSAHRPKSSRHGVVAIVPLQNAPQPGSDLRYRRVHPAAQRLLRVCQEISGSTSGEQAVVPIAMERVPSEPEFGHLLIRDFYAFGVGVRVEIAFHC